jgi:tartrate/fumarate subfamily iron-sulfur-dependent hydro-lyase alpha chain
MTIIRENDFVQSIADALQFISYYHPRDYIQALAAAYDAEESPAAKDAMAQILVNSRMCAEGHRPICQDTGMVVVFLKIGMDVRWDSTKGDSGDGRRGRASCLLHPDNVLRASMVSPPIGARKNTGDNTPAVVHTELDPGDRVEVRLAAKGGGSENKSKFAVLNPSDSLVDWVLKTVPTMGAGWCPPGMLGIGIGGSAEKAMLLAKESLMGTSTSMRSRRAARRTPSKAAPRAVREGQRTRHRRPGSRRADHGAGCEDPDLPHPCRLAPGRHDPELRGHATSGLRLDGSGPAALDTPEPGRLAADYLGRGRRGASGQSRHADPRRISRPGSRASDCCSRASC